MTRLGNTPCRRLLHSSSEIIDSTQISFENTDDRFFRQSSIRIQTFNENEYPDLEEVKEEVINEREPISLEDFKRIKLLGQGGFAKVWLVKEKTSGKFYAMKTISKARILYQDLVNEIINELNFHKSASERSNHVVKVNYAF